jgi:aminoglycoside phosphotransferase (APT) family kinase protein
MNETMRQKLQSYCQSQYPDRQALQVTNLLPLTGGMTHEMFVFDIEHGVVDRQREKLILRLYSGEGAIETSEREFHCSRWLHDAGYPVPRVHVLDRATSPIRKPFIIMERIEGRALWQCVVDLPEHRRGTLHVLFCKLLFQLHSIDWRTFAPPNKACVIDDPYVFADEYLAIERNCLSQHALTEFDPIVDWLQARRDDVPCMRPALTHGDFHYQNILLREDGSPVVIDWTTARIADPRVDLAWTLLLQQTHVDVHLRNTILQEYERLSGAKVQHLVWFETLACLWRLRHLAVLLSGGEHKLGMRSDAGALVRQNLVPYQKVYELLQLRTAIRVPLVEALFASVS